MAERNIVYIYHIFLISSSVVGYPGCFHSLAIVNGAAMNTLLHVDIQFTHHHLLKRLSPMWVFATFIKDHMAVDV
jgi:hypothetical protein